MGRRWLSESLRFIGWRPDTTSHQEKLISALGATLSLLVVYWVTHIGLDGDGALWVTGSMGASAVLVFAMPHGALSQPWSVVGGQVMSASLGVACVQWLPAGPWVAALAVGGSIFLMMYLRCLHPPGGATAMIVVLGGPAVESAGFHFVLYPILLDALIIVAAALLFNNLFEWRRYPLSLSHHQVARPPGIAPEDFHHALRQMNSYVDIEFDDLLKLVELANRHAKTEGVSEDDLTAGAFYSNGLPGSNWSVREVLQVVPRRPGRYGRVRYKTIKGQGEGSGGMCRLSTFVTWARYPVEQDKSGWHRVRPTATPKV
ncbi:HPP family protein [Halopseudomonas pelagia]|uniref:HPP family protein n=1 Tax=Halopseudomonas pelagia TaxID=553151 RepID=UPI0003B6993F|nr:HPP family protein [Halopseudomonas pelagia]